MRADRNNCKACDWNGKNPGIPSLRDHRKCCMMNRSSVSSVLAHHWHILDRLTNWYIRYRAACSGWPTGLWSLINFRLAPCNSRSEIILGILQRTLSCIVLESLKYYQVLVFELLLSSLDRKKISVALRGNYSHRRSGSYFSLQAV